jgi:cell division protein FtsZ
MIDAFALINEVSGLSVKGIADIITQPGHINVDFADVRTVMKDRGLALMATARAKGENRAEDAALNAITSPLLEDMCIQGARGVLLNITGDSSLSLHEVAKAASIVYEQADEDAHIIIGSVIDENMNNEVSVTVIATGFEQEAPTTLKVEAARAQEKDITYHKATVKKDESFYDYNTLQPTLNNQSDANTIDLHTLDIPAILRHHTNKVKEDN